jgi:hypothetical protein
LPDLVTPVTGRPISLAFALLLGCHILAGLTALASGAVAMLSRKRRGRHTRFGEIYFWAIVVVFITATGMAFLHWPQNAYLVLLGSLAFGAVSFGYLARERRWSGWLPHHILGMATSYIVLLTAFYVDNGPHLPLWNHLPVLFFWIAPTAVGLPLTLRALRRHTLRTVPG